MISNKVYNASEMSNSWNSATWQSTWESWLTEGVRNWWIYPIYVTNEILLHQQNNLESKRKEYEVQFNSIFNNREPKYWTKSSQCLIINHRVKRMKTRFCQFLSDPGVPGVRSMDPDVSNWLHPRPCADLTVVTNSRSPNCWPNLQLVHVVLSGGQNWN